MSIVGAPSIPPCHDAATLQSLAPPLSARTFTLQQCKRHHRYRLRLCFSSLLMLIVSITYCQQYCLVTVNGFIFAHRSSMMRPPTTTTTTTATTRMHAAVSNHNSQNHTPLISLEQVLQENGYGQRLMTIESAQLPVIAEVFCHGSFQLGRIVALERSRPLSQSSLSNTTCNANSSSSSSSSAPPLVRIELLSSTSSKGATALFDLGQVTTIWQHVDNDNDDVYHQVFLATGTINDDDNGNRWRSLVEQETQRFAAVNHCERSMQRLYNSHVGRGARGGTATATTKNGRLLSKRQISNLVTRQAPPSDGAHWENVLRRAIKAGTGMMRLVDSAVAMDYLYKDDNDYSRTTTASERIRRQFVAAHVLANDAVLGGRFKRMPCTYVSSESCDHHATNNDEGNNVRSVTLINGGWLAVDQSVRAGAEARKFAERTGTTNTGGDEGKPQLLTLADERIAHRLECLAMGEVFHSREAPWADAELEMDVREALKAMDLSVSPSGAQKALVRLGRWSENSQDRVRPEPWTKNVLEVARAYKSMDLERRRSLLKAAATSENSVKSSKLLEGRVDLTGLPCVCVDAKRTSFPDDAVGVRPRSGTGRRVIEDASKWEILIHITDVSDIYCPDVLPVGHEIADLGLLQDAAARRGTSRYDLPLGPLHLMPPIVLEALSLQTIKVDTTNKANQLNGSRKTVNRCVTLWAYIDERNGKLIDAGLERTLVSMPISLSFAVATSLLEGKLSSPSLKQAKAILAVAERNLSLWSEQRRTTSETARKREDRLSARELVAQEQGVSRQSDDGRSGFQRTRGHRIVDAALDLYGNTVTRLLRRAKANVPMSSGSAAARGGRVGTAPLRRYIDGIAQRQVLAVLCAYGGRPLTKDECITAGAKATAAKNALANVRSAKRKGVLGTDKQKDALRLLKTHLAGGNRPVPAVSTGRENEVVIVGVGATAKCKGVKGSLKPGDRVMVDVKIIDPERGRLSVALAELKEE